MAKFSTYLGNSVMLLGKFSLMYLTSQKLKKQPSHLVKQYPSYYFSVRKEGKRLKTEKTIKLCDYHYSFLRFLRSLLFKEQWPSILRKKFNNNSEIFDINNKRKHFRFLIFYPKNNLPLKRK